MPWPIIQTPPPSIFCRRPIMNPNLQILHKKTTVQQWLLANKLVLNSYVNQSAPDGAPNSAVHPGPQEKLVDWQAWRMWSQICIK